MEKKLRVKNLTVSFRTTGGLVRAVRGIDFDLEKGETLAIVGESGSGKSVTSKSILGILANNAVIEGGEIIYDGKDLLSLSEDDFHRLRGDKIAMIFQDPMSSLNPIIKIGRQLTEAMLLKGRARQRESRRTFNTYLKNLKEHMIKVEPERAEELTRKCREFDRFEYKHLELESAYNRSYEAAQEAVDDIDRLMFELEKDAATDVRYRTENIRHLAGTSVSEFMVSGEEAKKLSAQAAAACRAVRASDSRLAIDSLRAVRDILDAALSRTAPNFFALGYCRTFEQDPPSETDIEALNNELRRRLDSEFMLDFIADVKKALRSAAEETDRNRFTAVEVLRNHRAVFEKERLEERECREALNAMSAAVARAIDPLEMVKDSFAHTFNVSVTKELDRYFGGIGHNARETKRYERDKARHDRLSAAGKEPDWSVIPPAVTDLDLVRSNILAVIDRLAEHFEHDASLGETRDYDALSVAVIDFLKDSASGVVHKVTKRSAKRKALKLMEEVGIPNARRRYNQYPFEFSGGMRQRIVIAIALAADPDILICDEPTTALDVTIQAQILELINRFKEKRKLSIIFITHDLGVVANMADRIAVMYAGKIVEYGTAEDIFYHSAHPYTWALLSSMPDLDTQERLDAIPGTPPNMIYPPKGDAFAERNKYALKIDFERQPPMFRISDTHYAATWLLHPDAPRVEPPRAVTERIARMKQKRGDDNGK